MAALLKVRLQPRASSNAIIGWRGVELAVRLTAPPVQGEANRALTEYLAETLGVRRGDILVARGLKSRSKVLEIECMTPEQLATRLEELGFPPSAAE